MGKGEEVKSEAEILDIKRGIHISLLEHVHSKLRSAKLSFKRAQHSIVSHLTQNHSREPITLEINARLASGQERVEEEIDGFMTRIEHFSAELEGQEYEAFMEAIGTWADAFGDLTYDLARVGDQELRPAVNFYLGKKGDILVQVRKGKGFTEKYLENQIYSAFYDSLRFFEQAEESLRELREALYALKEEIYEEERRQGGHYWREGFTEE